MCHTYKAAKADARCLYKICDIDKGLSRKNLSAVANSTWQKMPADDCTDQYQAAGQLKTAGEK